MLQQAEEISIERRKQSLGDDVTGLQELIMYGLKGAAAYADHALVLGRELDSAHAFFAEALCRLLTEQFRKEWKATGGTGGAGGVGLRGPREGDRRRGAAEAVHSRPGRLCIQYRSSGRGSYTRVLEGPGTHRGTSLAQRGR